MPTVPDIHRRGTRADQATVASPPLTVGTLYFVTDEGVTERWNGSAWEVYSGAGTGSPPPPSPPGATLTTFLVSGGQVVWESAYTFRVSAADYYILGTRYASAEDTATLGAAHATLDRLDVIALDTPAPSSCWRAPRPRRRPSRRSTRRVPEARDRLRRARHRSAARPGDDARLRRGRRAAARVDLDELRRLHRRHLDHDAACRHKSIEGTNVVAGVYAQGTIGSGRSTRPTTTICCCSSEQGRVEQQPRPARHAAPVGRAGRRGGADSAQWHVRLRLDADNRLPDGRHPDAGLRRAAGVEHHHVRLEDFGGAIGFFVDDISFQAAATHSRRRRADAGPGRRALCAARPCGAACARRGGPAAAGGPGRGGGRHHRRRRQCDYDRGEGRPVYSICLHDYRVDAHRGCVGSVVLDLKLSASYATTPTVSIVASAPPTLSSALTAQDATLTG